MRKKVFSDIVPPERQKVPLREAIPVDREHHGASRRPPVAGIRHRKPIREPEESAQPADMYFEERPKRSRFRIWAGAFGILAVLVLAFSFFFSGAKVVAFPREVKTAVDAEFTAKKSGAENELTYEVMTFEDTVSRTVEATGEEFVEERASGTIIVFNAFTSADQRFVPNTRFETPEGLVFRTRDSIVIPGMTEDESGQEIPGRVEVAVYADQPGDAYNIGLTDFTVPGLEGLRQFDSIFARSKTPMEGGFTGNRVTVNESDLARVRGELREEIRSELLGDAFSEKPEGFLLFEDGVFVVFESLPAVESGGNAEIREKATLYGVLFPEGAFARNLAKSVVPGFEDAPVEILNPADLVFAIPEKESVRPWEGEDIGFTLKGQTHIAWLFDEEVLRQDLAGKAKAALPTVLSGYPSIDQAEVIIRPFWKSSFPEDIENIVVERVIEGASE